MLIFDRYILKNLAIAAVFITLTLTFIVFLTQSLRFLEVVINAGSAGNAFWILTALALPRFLEVILPLSVMAATLFLYNKMILDSELIAMKAIGHSHISLAKPAIAIGSFAALLLLVITFWLAPISANKMHKMRLELTSEFSSILFREGIFNPISKGLTVYIGNRAANGELLGLMIHDTRDLNKPPSTVLAKRGIILDSEKGPQVVVFNGSRHEYNSETGVLQRLAFDRYTIQLPENEQIPQRWQQPDERTISELLNPDMSNKRDIENIHQFSVEIHRRITTPLLAIVFTLIALNALLLGKTDRRGQAPKIISAIITIVILQGLYISAANTARLGNYGIFMMYLSTIAPLVFSMFTLTERGQDFIINTIKNKSKSESKNESGIAA